MKIRPAHIILLLFGFSRASFSQHFIEPDKMKAFNVTVNYDDYTVKTQMLKDPKQFKPKPELTYSWYTSQKIIETKGGYEGKLLHGYYHSFYLSNQLRESGEYTYGVKTGEWRNWYEDGKLKEVSHWKKGRKRGAYYLYNDYGLLMAKGRFRNDVLHGKFYTYDHHGKIASVKKYKHGVEILKKEVRAPDKLKKGRHKLFNGKNKNDSLNATTENALPELKKERKNKVRKEKHPDSDKTDGKKNQSPEKDKKTFRERIKAVFKPKENKPKSNDQSTTL